MQTNRRTPARRLRHGAAALLAGLLVALAVPAAAEPRWAPIGPDYGTVLTAAHLPTDGSVMLAGTYFGGLYRSTNWGYDWVPVDGGFTSATVLSLGFDTRSPGRVFAGLYQEGVWRSTDAGASWTRTATGLSDGTVQAVAPDPAVSARVLAATPSGLFASDDAGTSWQAVPSLAGVSTRSIAHDPLRPGVVFVGTIGQGVYRSADHGASWAPFGGGRVLPTVSALSYDAAGNLYAAGSDGGVYQLPAGGEIWADLTFDLPLKEPVEHVLAHPTAPGVLMAATRLGTYVISNWNATPRWFLWHDEGSRFIATDPQGLLVHVAGQIGSLRASTDFGATWTRADHGIQTAFIGGIATAALGGSWRLFAGADLGVSTLEFGQPWRNPLPLNEGVFDVHVRGNAVYAGTETSGVYKSGDGGTTWSVASLGIVPSRIVDLAFSSGSAPTLLAASGNGAFRSTDGGANWTPIRLTGLSFVSAVAPDPVRPPIVWLGGGGGRVYRSLDSGVNFEFAGNGLPAEDVVQLVHAPWSSVYALMSGGKLYNTTDNGVSWFPTAASCASPGAALQLDPGRPWVLYLATSGGGICKSENGGLSWVAANNGLTQLGLTSLWIDPRDASRLWAGAVGKLYRSTDAGASWAAQTSGLADGAVVAIEGDPANPARMLALVYGAGLFESLDGGANWALRSNAAAARTALSLQPHPADAGRLLLGTETQGVQASADGGQSFADSSRGMSLFVRSIASDPGDAATLYAGTLGGGVFRSRDAAASWSAVGKADGSILRLRSPSAQRVLVGTGNGVAESLDGGGSWANLGLPVSHVLSMAADPADPRRVLVGGVAGHAWLSDASGARWTMVGAGLPALELRALASCPDGTLWAAPERAGVWRNQIAAPGAWTRPANAGLGDARVDALACDPRTGFLYAATNGQGVWLSMNGGAGWTAINQGLAGSVMRAVVVSPTRPWQVWATVGDATVYRSDDAGLHWSAAGSGLPPGGVSFLAAGPDETYYVATAAGVYRRLAAATTWSKASSGLPSGVVSALWADPARAGVVLAAIAGRGLFRSSNSGTSWVAASLDTLTADVATIAGAGSGTNARIHIGTAGTGVARSVDGGASFGTVQPAAELPQVVTDIAIDGADPQTLYLAAAGQRVLASRDGGAHWRLAAGGLASNDSALAVVAHPQRGGELYAGTHNGVYVSRDHGGSWTAMNSGLVNKNVTALHFDAVFPDLLYVGLEGGGIWFISTSP